MKIFYQTKLINILLLSGLIVLAICGLLAYRQVQHLAIANERVIHTHQVINAANQTLLYLTEAGSRLNYYIISNNKSIIQDLPTIIATTKENMTLLKTLTRDNPIQLNNVNQLEPLVNARIALVEKIAAVNDVKANPLVLQLAISANREQLREKIDRLINEINQEEERLLQQRNTLVLREAHISNLLYAIFGSLSAIFLILSIILLNHNFRLRNIAERKQAETERELLLSNKHLLESEERYLLATEGSSAGLWDWEVGTDRVFFSNYFKKMLGYTDEEFPNSLQSFEKVIHPSDHNRAWDSINQHLEKHVPYKSEYRLRTKSGDYSWYQAAGQAIWNNNGIPTRMSGSIIDITERKKAEQRLAIQHAVAEILSDATSLEEVTLKIIKVICENLGWESGAIWMVDKTTNLLICKGVWHQYSASPLLKKFEDETLKTQLSYGIGLPGRIWKMGKASWFTDIIHDKKFSRAKVAEEIGLNSAFGFPIMVQKTVLGVIECFTLEQETADPHILDLMQAVGSQIGQFISRKTAEAELKESESYKSAILMAATDSIITIDDNNKIISFNPQTTREFHCTSEELHNTNIQTILPNFDLKKRDESNNVGFEAMGLTKNGESFPVEIKISKMNIDQHNMSVVFIRNITERKKVEIMKNEFVSVVSHELRTPLTSIRGALGLVLGGTVGEFPEKAKKLLDLANNNCERLLLLINDILDIEKIEAGKLIFDFRVVGITDLVNESIIANKIYADKYKVKLRLAQSESDLKINVDPGRLMQVLANLISNAIKFSPQGEEVIFNIKKYHDNVRVLISNKGPGIPLEFQSHIFQKFSQADASNTRGKGGTGLGLSISKAIIENLGGTLNFVSKPGEITTFYFDLPLWHDQQKNIEQNELQQNKIEDQKTLERRFSNTAVQGQEKILICEDDEDQANYLRNLLETAGFQSDLAYNVASAKLLLKKNNYRVLLLDLILPDQDGISFIRELRNNEQTRTLPIIVLSVIAQTGRILLDGETFSVTDWLDKPIDFEKLLQSIQHIKKQIHPKVPNILHVEDDLDTFKAIQTLLDKEANVISATSIHDAIEKLKTNKFDLVILDLLLPDGNAESLIPLIAEYKLPIIVYSIVELNKKLKKEVKHALLKSETSNEKLLKLIENVLEKQSIGDHDG